MAGDRQRVLGALAEAGVGGASEFGRFINNTTYFAPSAFDERAAMPVLLQLLPDLTDPAVVGSLAGHLRRPWARPHAFQPLLAAYRRFGGEDAKAAGWHLADALSNAATASDLAVLLELAQDTRLGKSRQMLVHALWRFRKDDRVASVLAPLCGDPAVALHAMSAYRRTVGNEEALPLLRSLREHPSEQVRKQATQQAKKAEKAAAAARG